MSPGTRSSCWRLGDSLRAVLTRVRPYVPLDTVQVSDIIDRLPGPLPARAGLRRCVLRGGRQTGGAPSALPGLVIQAEPKRLYPAGKSVAHLVGYVSEVTEADLAADRYPGAVLGSIVGKAGLEREYDDTLRGSEGVRYIEVNARGRLVREGAPPPALSPTPGKPIVTTTGPRPPAFHRQHLAREYRGAMVAMTPSGEIRALYSAPSFDPNHFIGGISSAEWRKLNNDPAKPLLNRVIQARYPPASPFKLAIAAMALKRGLIRLDTLMPEPCRGGCAWVIGSSVVGRREGHGSLDLTGAVAASCDVYFYQLGLRLGLDAIIQDGLLMGFKDKSGIDLENELNPIYPSSSAYFDKLYGPRTGVRPAPHSTFRSARARTPRH